VRVSFIVPALNVEATLEACLDAILAAAPRTVEREVLVIDNGSTDRTVEIARARGARVISAPGLSVAALRNLGAQTARGDILACVDADCVIGEGWLTAALAHFDDPTVGAVGAPTAVPEDATWVQRMWALHRHRRTTLRVVDWLPTENLVLRKSAFQAIDGFNATLATCEDVDLCYRLGQRHRILSDPALRSIHLGEAPTLARFFRKERWRGRGNLAGLFAHRLRLAELPSVALPLYYLAGMLALPLTLLLCTLVGGPAWLLAAGAALLALPAMSLALAVAIQVGRLRAWPALALVYFVYGLARAVALLPAAPPRAATPTRATARPSPVA
jgi:hypothetical protein